jgi:glycosyltransferase involved in cell wall biosynthesis
VPAIQKQADVLFLPLAFESPYPAIIKTSAPFKMGEYLSSRRPVVVHAPPDSFVAWYFRRHKCGVVVDRASPEPLAENIEVVLRDEELQRRLAASAWERARVDFGMNVARGKFMRLLAGRAAGAQD